MECFKPNKKSFEADQTTQIVEFANKFKKGFKTWQVVQMPHDQLVLFYEADEKIGDINSMRPSKKNNTKDDFKF